MNATTNQETMMSRPANELIVEYESIGDAPIDPETGEDDEGDAGPEGIPKHEQPSEK